MLTAKQKSILLNKAADLLEEANALVQEAMGASDECYYVATQIENARDDIIDAITAVDEEIDA